MGRCLLAKMLAFWQFSAEWGANSGKPGGQKANQAFRGVPGHWGLPGAVGMGYGGLVRQTAARPRALGVVRGGHTLLLAYSAGGILIMGNSNRDYSHMGKAGYARSVQVAQERKAAARRFRRDLLRELGQKAKWAAVREVVDSAVASHAAVMLLSNKVLTARATAWDFDMLARMQGQLNRTLRLLGIRLPGTDEIDSEDCSAPPRGATPEQRRAWSQDYVARTLAEGKGAAQ